jgi:thiamine-phosphate pyrophosphorylase
VTLCLVTDRRRRAVVEQGRAAVAAGIDLIQVRERDLDGGALSALVAELVRLTRGTQTRVIVNERLDVALACGADGVHLRGDSVPAAHARSMAPPGFLIGRSVRDVGVAAAEAPSSDYLIAGTVFPSSSKPGLRECLGVEGLATIVRAVAVPVLAIGGISLDRIDAVAKTGAAGIAAIGLFFEGFEGDMPLATTVREARLRFDSGRSAS